MTNDRIAKLSERFTTHTQGRDRPAAPARARQRHSFYLDAALTRRLDVIYREVNHRLYPQAISKSVFLETVLEYGLEHLDALMPIFVGMSDPDEPSATS